MVSGNREAALRTTNERLAREVPQAPNAVGATGAASLHPEVRKVMLISRQSARPAFGASLTTGACSDTPALFDEECPAADVGEGPELYQMLTLEYDVVIIESTTHAYSSIKRT